MGGKQSINENNEEEEIGTLRKNLNVPDRMEMSGKEVRKLARSRSVLLKDEKAEVLMKKLSAFMSPKAHRLGMREEDISSKDEPQELLKIVEVQVRSGPLEFIKELINGNGVQILIAYQIALLNGSAITKKSSEDIQKNISILSMILVHKMGEYVVEDTNSFVVLIKSIEKATLRNQKLIFKTLSHICKQQEVRNQIEIAIEREQTNVEPIFRFKSLIDAATNLNGDPLLQKEIIEFLGKLVIESPTTLKKFELKTELKLLGFNKELQTLLEHSDSDELKSSIHGYFAITRRLDKRLRE